VMVTSLAFMTGVVASASEDGTVKLWDVKEGKETKSWNAHSGGVAWVDFAPDGRLVSCGRDKIAKVWDQTGKELAKIAEPFSDIALRAALSNDRIIAGDWTGEIRVCSLDGKRIGDLTANPPSIAERLEAVIKNVAASEAAVLAARAKSMELEAKLNTEKAALDAAKKQQGAEEEARRLKLAADRASIESSISGLEKRLETEKNQLAVERKARDEAGDAERAAAQGKVDAQKKQIAATEGEIEAGHNKLMALAESDSGL